MNGMNNGDGRRSAGGISETSYRLSVLAAVLAAALILGGFFYGMVRLGVVRIPVGTDDETAQTTPPGPEDQLIDSLRRGSWPDDAVVTYDILPEDYLTMLSEAPYIEEYELIFDVTVSSTSSRSAEEHHVKKTASGFEVETYREKRLVSKVKSSGDGL